VIPSSLITSIFMYLFVFGMLGYGYH